MPKEIKIIFIGLFVLPIIAFIWVIIKNGQPQPVLTDVSALSVTPSSISLGDIPRLGGVVTKEFTLKNTSDQIIKLKKITTSCMCTKAKAIVDGQETALFGMESPGDQNAPVNLDILPGTEFKVVFVFDPNAHGPRGVGPIDRSVDLTFSNPSGIKELKFNGTVL
jgi:hypothetical protein